jgi:NTE family protein
MFALPVAFRGWDGPVRHLQNWASALHARLFGSPGHFRPRWAPPTGNFTSLYSLAPMRERIRELVDFGRLNSGDIRLSIATTDIETGDLVVFDTGHGARIELDHLLASCGYIPEFAPVEIGGRLLGDGGLSANAPIEAVLDVDRPPSVIIVADLFARDGSRPIDLESALARKNDLMFANQTFRRIEAFRRQAERLQKSEFNDFPQIVHLSYRAPPVEAGPERPFDLSRATIEDRWRAGELDCIEGCRALEHSNQERVISIRRQP